MNFKSSDTDTNGFYIHIDDPDARHAPVINFLSKNLLYCPECSSSMFSESPHTQLIYNISRKYAKDIKQEDKKEWNRRIDFNIFNLTAHCKMCDFNKTVDYALLPMKEFKKEFDEERSEELDLKEIARACYLLKKIILLEKENRLFRYNKTRLTCKAGLNLKNYDEVISSLEKDYITKINKIEDDFKYNITFMKFK